MATTSEVKAGLNKASTTIATMRARLVNYKKGFANEASTLGNFVADLGLNDIVTEINGYAPTGAFETLSKDELARLVTEFQALKVDVDAAVADLATYSEF